MNRANLAIGLALTVGSPAFAASPPPAPEDVLLYAAITAPAKISYTGVVQVLRIGNHTSEASVYRVEHRAPDLTRRDYTAPSAVYGDTVISKGEMSFSIDARRRRIVETRNGALDDRVALDDNVVLLRQNYRIVQRDSETFDGRPTIAVLLVNKYDHRPTMLVRIDRETDVVLDKQEFTSDGSLLAEVRLAEVHYSSTIASTDFALPKQYRIVKGPSFGEPSQDTDQIVRNAGFPARAPKTLPQGFAPVEGSLVDLKGVRTLHVLYSDGIRTVSLFENATASTLDMAGLQPQRTTIGGRSAQYAEDGAMALLAWDDGRLHYALVGELRLSALRQIATSIAP